MSISAFLSRRKQTEAETAAAALAAYHRAVTAAAGVEDLPEKTAAKLVELAEKCGHLHRLESDILSVRKHREAQALSAQMPELQRKMAEAWDAKHATAKAIIDAQRADTQALIAVGLIQQEIGKAAEARNHLHRVGTDPLAIIQRADPHELLTGPVAA